MIARPVRGLAALVSLVAVAVLAGMAHSAGADATGGIAADLGAGQEGVLRLEGAESALDTGRLEGPAGAVDDVSLRLGATGDGASARVTGTVEAAGVALLGGRVRVDALRVDAVAAPGGLAGLSGVSVEGLEVDGRPIEAVPGSRVELAGVGELFLAERALTPSGGIAANALRLEIQVAGNPLPVGASAVIGHLELAAPAPPAAQPAPAPPAAAPAPRRPPSQRPAPVAPRVPGAGEGGSGLPADRPLPDPTPVRPPGGEGSVLPGPPSGSAGSPQIGLPRRPAPPLEVTGSEYVFPVSGDGYGYIDDYGAPRAGTGWHHGIDIFAPIGTPLVAVADGVVSKVGVNTLGGNRLWLTDEAGNAYYYAHLSAYSPRAVDGARVQAGEVLGFVGNTGQAITTPPHLHFEIHPAGLDSVNPYPYLLAWERETQVARAFRAAELTQGQVPASGAVLVAVEPARDEPPAGDGLARAVP